LVGVGIYKNFSENKGPGFNAKEGQQPVTIN